MNKQAMEIPKDQLLSELERRRNQKTAKQAGLNSRYGKNRIRIYSYMENIGWPELFGYDMNHFFNDADFTIEQTLRQKIFWADNVDDETIPDFVILADIGMYWDATLFGQQIRHSPDGVPKFLPHPLQSQTDSELPREFDFHTSGDMPKLCVKYEKMKEIASNQYGDRLQITFPQFHRGPLDIYIQLRGYENFLADVMERPEQLREALNLIVNTRLSFSRERAGYLGEPLSATAFVADDWVNIPFISPDIFRDFVLSAYERIQNNEGPVTGFHTCGNLVEIVEDLLGVFPEIRQLDVSPWNDLTALDAAVNPQIKFNVNIKNTVSLGGCEDAQLQILKKIASIARHRKVPIVCAAAIVKFCPTYEETLGRLNCFLALYGKILSHT